MTIVPDNTNVKVLFSPITFVCTVETIGKCAPMWVKSTHGAFPTAKTVTLTTPLRTQGELAKCVTVAEGISQMQLALHPSLLAVFPSSQVSPDSMMLFPQVDTGVGVGVGVGGVDVAGSADVG